MSPVDPKDQAKAREQGFEWVEVADLQAGDELRVEDRYSSTVRFFRIGKVTETPKMKRLWIGGRWPRNAHAFRKTTILGRRLAA